MNLPDDFETNPVGTLKKLKWISVEDRLPEVDRNVIVSDQDGYMSVAHTYRIRGNCHWTPSNIDSYDYGLCFEPTHWMPLPEPPE